MPYRGPYALNDVEAVAGEFTQVLMRAVESIAFTPGLQLTTIGLRWPCGCETRGTGTPDNLPACVLAACVAHADEFEDRPERPTPVGFEDPNPIVIPRALAVGNQLVLRVDPAPNEV